MVFFAAPPGQFLRDRRRRTNSCRSLRTDTSSRVARHKHELAPTKHLLADPAERFPPLAELLGAIIARVSELHAVSIEGPSIGQRYDRCGRLVTDTLDRGAIEAGAGFQ